MSDFISSSAPASVDGRFSPTVRALLQGVPARWPGVGVEFTEHQGEESADLFSERHGLAFLSLNAHGISGVQMFGPGAEKVGEHQAAEGLDAAVTGFMDAYGAALCRYGFKEA